MGTFKLRVDEKTERNLPSDGVEQKRGALGAFTAGAPERMGRYIPRYLAQAAPSYGPTVQATLMRIFYEFDS